MRKTRRAALRLASSAALLAIARDTRAAEPADLVLKNAAVHTVDAKRPRAEAEAAPRWSSAWRRL